MSIAIAFQKIISKGGKAESEGRRILNKIQADQVGEFDSYLFKKFLKLNNIEMYLTYNKGKSLPAGRFIRTLKNTILKHKTPNSWF